MYARVSDPKQVEDGLSIEAQLAQLHAWATQKGYSAREYVDAGRSAWTENLNKRPGFLQMLGDVRTGALDGVAVTHIDRFSRRLLVTLTALGEFGQHGVGFVSLENSAFDFSRPADRLLLQVLGAFAEYYSSELSRKVKRGLALRASRGLKVGTLEFGYCNSRCVDCKNADPPCPRWGTISKDAPPLLHPTDATGVLLAFETYRRSNMSDDDVAGVMNSAGFRSRTTRGRVLWNKHSIKELLTNLHYTGVVVFKGQEIQGKHPAIISRELFDEVQAIRRKRRRHQATFNKKYRVYLFSGIIKCSKCGRGMRASTRTTRNRKCYHCMSRELKHECEAKNTWAYEEGLAVQFEEIVVQFQLPDDWRTRVCELLNASGKQPNAESERRCLTERLARLKKQFQWSDISEAEYIQQRDEIKGALAGLQAPEMTAIVDAADYLQNMARVWKEATDEEQRDMTRAILDEVVCDPDLRRLVSLRPKPPFKMLFRQIRGLAERDGVFDMI